MKARCHGCLRPFGLARKTGYYIMGLFIHELQFCSQKCKDLHDTELQKKREKQRYNRWLCS